MKVGDLELNGTPPKWLDKMRKAQEIAKQADQEADLKRQNEMLRLAFGEMQDAAITAAANGSQWHKTALKEFFRMRQTGHGGPQKRSLLRLAFLECVVAAYPESDITAEELVAEVVCSHKRKAHGLWDQRGEKLERAIERFLRENGRLSKLKAIIQRQ